MINREKLEQNQIWLYVAILVVAAGLGLLAPNLMTTLDNHILISVVIAVLMFGMFTQIPFTSIKESLGNRRFILAILTANYIAVPYCSLAVISVPASTDFCITGCVSCFTDTVHRLCHCFYSSRPWK